MAGKKLWFAFVVICLLKHMSWYLQPQKVSKDGKSVSPCTGVEKAYIDTYIVSLSVSLALRGSLSLSTLPPPSPTNFFCFFLF